MKKITHEDEKLNSLIGKEVKIVLADNREERRILQKDEWDKNKYLVAYKTPNWGCTGICFFKSHVKKVMEI